MFLKLMWSNNYDFINYKNISYCNIAYFKKKVKNSK